MRADNHWDRAVNGYAAAAGVGETVAGSTATTTSGIGGSVFKSSICKQGHEQKKQDDNLQHHKNAVLKDEEIESAKPTVGVATTAAAAAAAAAVRGSAGFVVVGVCGNKVKSPGTQSGSIAAIQVWHLDYP